MTQEQLAGIFEEWQQRYLLDPEGFMSHLDHLSTTPMEYGELAARYFMFLVDELEGGVK